MSDRSHSPKKNPLGLHLDFLFGKGYLWAKNEPISDWINLKHLKMEIPDLSFPFDVRTGLTRFQHTRCFGREVSFDISEVGLGDLLRQGLKEVEGFDDLQINFLDGAAHIAVRVKALGADTFLSFRAALVPPEPARGDEVHLSLYDYRAYGPLPYPARVLGFELLSRLLQTHRLRPPGKGSAYKIGIAGDLLNLRPIKILLLHVFVKAGWKLPDLSSVRLREVRLSPGRLSIISHSPDINTPVPELHEKFGLSPEGIKAVGAYEAKDLFMQPDNALFATDIASAYKGYTELRQHYGTNAELNERILDCLLSMPTLANLAEAESICRDLEKDNENDLRAKLVRATIASLRNSESTADAYKSLSKTLREKGELYDYVLSELARATFISPKDPEAAARVLAEVLSVAPRHRGVLEELRRLYERIGNTTELEGVLKRLTGVYSDRESLTETYLELARHLMNRRGEMGEARIFLERVLRLNPTHLEALEILGESYILSGEPLRALKAFSSASRAAENLSNANDASNMMFKVSKIWIEEVGDSDQALLAIRRSLELEKLAQQKSGEKLLFAASLCQERERFDEAMGYYLDAANLFESEPGIESRILAASAHFSLGKIYYQRDRLAPSADHLERSFTIDPSSLEVLDLLAKVHSELGLPDKLLALYQEASLSLGHTEISAEVHYRMAILLQQMGLDSHAEKALKVTLGIRLDHRSATVAYFTLLGRQGRHKDLDEIATRYIAQRNSVSAKAELLLDWSREKEGKVRVKKLIRAFEFSPLHPEIIQDIFDIYERDRDRELRSALERIANSAEIEPSKKATSLLKGVTSVERQKSSRNIEGNIDKRLDELLSREEDRVEPEQLEKETKDIAQVEAEPEKKYKLDDFRTKLDKALRTRNALPKPEDIRDGTPLAKIIGSHKLHKKESAEIKQDLEEVTQESLDLNALKKQPEKYVVYLAEMVRNETNEKRRLTLTKELGELYFFELENNEKARPYLETVRDEDPNGLGQDEALLSALESIYEESGDADARIDILKNRFHRAESEEMREVYAILIAQLIWEEFEDLDRAMEWLRPLLQKDIKHEAANRLSAELLYEAGVFDRAVKHFRNVLEVAPDGLDSIEVERKVAEILLLELNKPEDAKKHYLNVLKSAPGDARALDGVKQSQATLGDWVGYVNSLSHELGLLLGKMNNFGIDEARGVRVEDIVVQIRVPASQIYADLGKVMESQLFDLGAAFDMFGLSYELWPENVESLESRIKLARNLGENDALSHGLEQLSDMLFDPRAKFDALTESARLCTSNDKERARSLFATAIAIAEAGAPESEGLDAARRAFAGLSKK